jgi:hypothetical protein
MLIRRPQRPATLVPDSPNTEKRVYEACRSHVPATGPWPLLLRPLPPHPLPHVGPPLIRVTVKIGCGWIDSRRLPSFNLGLLLRRLSPRHTSVKPTHETQTSTNRTDVTHYLLATLLAVSEAHKHALGQARLSPRGLAAIRNRISKYARTAQEGRTPPP